MFHRRRKHPWDRCQLEMCDCTDRNTREKLPDDIRYLIHERDWHSAFHTARARRAENLLDNLIEFMIGDNPNLQTAEDLECYNDSDRKHWADKISQIPYDEDFRVASPDSLPLRATGALR